jgi:hypothetical protein
MLHPTRSRIDDDEVDLCESHNTPHAADMVAPARPAEWHLGQHPALLPPERPFYQAAQTLDLPASVPERHRGSGSLTNLVMSWCPSCPWWFRLSPASRPRSEVKTA